MLLPARRRRALFDLYRVDACRHRDSEQFARIDGVRICLTRNCCSRGRLALPRKFAASVGEDPRRRFAVFVQCNHRRMLCFRLNRHRAIDQRRIAARGQRGGDADFHVVVSQFECKRYLGTAERQESGCFMHVQFHASTEPVERPHGGPVQGYPRALKGKMASCLDGIGEPLRVAG
jgi:hypothetical protein